MQLISNVPAPMYAKRPTVIQQEIDNWHVVVKYMRKMGIQVCVARKRAGGRRRRKEEKKKKRRRRKKKKTRRKQTENFALLFTSGPSELV